jgi:fluoride exporter
MRADRRELAAVFAGGFLGALARAGLVEALPHGAILVANVLGTFALGYFVTRLQERLPLSAYRRPFVGTGVCGGLTTFSTLQIELLDMRPGAAAAYALASVAAGFAAVAVATNLVRAG